MAEVFLVRDGTVSDHHASRPHAVAMDELLEKLTPFETRYSVVPFDFNGAHGPARASDPYRHVVVRVDEVEINGSFPEGGYYHVTGLTADDARGLFGIPD